MASSCLPDIWSWIQGLPPITLWPTDSISICIYHSSSKSSQQYSLHFSLNKLSSQNQSPPSLLFSVLIAHDHHPNHQYPMSLWSSKSFQLNNPSTVSADEENNVIPSLFYSFINGILSYNNPSNYNNCSSAFLHNISSLDTNSTHFKGIFNLSFFALALLICIYEAPYTELRSEFLDAIQDLLTSAHSREAWKMLMRVLGSNIEEQWMRSLNLAITSWAIEVKTSSGQYYSSVLRKLSPMFSYSMSATGLWKVQLCCPTIAMDVEKTSRRSGCKDERLMFSLWYHQLESVIQFGYGATVQEKSVDVVINVDNIRCDVVQLVSETLMKERGAGPMEKHFPSRISLQLTPTFQANILSVSVSKSSENPVHEIGSGVTFEGAFDPPNSLGLKVSATKSNTMSIKPWKFEQSVHDSKTGLEVVSSKPPWISLFRPKAWFKNQHLSTYRPFNKQGGVVFAGDEYGEKVLWKVERGVIGKTMEWEIKGCIWLTYWPDKNRAFYHESRKLEFREMVHLSIP